LKVESNWYDTISTANAFLVVDKLGIILLIVLVVALFISSLKDIWNVIFNPKKYIEDKHKKLFDDMIEELFSNRVNDLIENSINCTLKELEDCFYEDKIKSVINHSIDNTLTTTGIQRNLDAQKSVLLILTKKFINEEFKRDSKRYKLNLLFLMKANAEKVKVTIGTNSPTSYSYYINLRSILTDSDYATKLSYILAGSIYKYIEQTGSTFDFIAVNRNSNAILGYLISNFLNKPLLIVNYSPEMWNKNGEEVTIDGLEHLGNFENKKGFLVDDAVSGGRILKNSVHYLKEKKLIADNVFVFFTRKEDNAKNSFREDNINLHSIFDVDDKLIEKIIQTDENDLESIIDDIK
jgi:orotate phosphoribosyltransferase